MQFLFFLELVPLGTSVIYWLPSSYNQKEKKLIANQLKIVSFNEARIACEDLSQLGQYESIP